MCGIFGQITKSVNSLCVPEVNILGMLNVERGKNSCGLTYDGEIFLGLDKDKIYTDFIKKRNIKPKQYPTIFGHTRQSSSGAINAFNAHPFGFGTLPNGEYEFIGCHNGTLKNPLELAKKYGVDIDEDYINEYNYPAVRRKIDSEILLEILYKTKSYKVLSEYIGGAALAWTWIGEPNKMYLWSGASKLWEHSKDKEEERPLCVYQKSKNNTYFSSLEESLYALGGTEANVCQIDYNTVYVITDGDFKNADKLPVSRTKVGQNEFYTPKTTTNRNFAYGNHTDDETWDGYDPSYHGRVNTQFSSVRKHTPSANTSIISIHKEPHFVEVPKRYGKIYFHKLRYWRNGHVINGIYTDIKGYGLYEIGKTIVDAKNTISSNTGVKFVNGMFDKLCKEKDKGIVPFKLGSKPAMFYIVQGVMVKTLEDYVTLSRQADILAKNQPFLGTIEMSYCSKHPVINISSGSEYQSSDHLQNIWFEGALFTGTICPFGSERIYEIQGGNLKNYKVRKDISMNVVKNNSETVIVLPENIKNTFNVQILDEAIKNIEKFESEYEKNESLDESVMTTEDLNKDVDEMLMEMINEEFTNPIMHFNRLKDSLKEYLPNPIAKETISIIDSFNKVLTTFLVEPKK